MAVAQFLNAASGLPLIALGLLVLLIRPRRTANSVFAVFSIAWGARHVSMNVAEMEVALVDVLYQVTAVAHVVALVALVWLALVMPERPGPAERRAVWVSVVVGTVVALVPTVAVILVYDVVVEQIDSAAFPFLVMMTTYFWMMGAQVYAMLLWTLRYLHTPVDGWRLRRQYALMTAALGAWTGFILGAGPAPDGSVSLHMALLGGDVWMFLVLGVPLLVLLMVAGLWLYAEHRKQDARIGRNTAWFLLAMPLLGGLYWYGDQPWGAFALTRIVAFGLLAVAILRFQLLSLDLKIRWTVSRSTVAAAFVVVYFVVSETAAVFFGGNFQNEYLGIAGAALLVLALVPIQRWADRVAATAVPGPSGPAFDAARAETSYRNAVRLALANRTIDAEEEVQLAELADTLGLSGARATEIRMKVMRR